MSDTLTGLARQVNEHTNPARLDGPRPTAGYDLALARRIEAFAASEPRWDPHNKAQLLARLARRHDIGCPIDADAAIAVLVAAAQREADAAGRQ